MIKTIIFAAFIMVLGFVNRAMAQDNAGQASDYKMALGIRLSSSSPTLSNAVTGKYFINERDAVEGIISFGSKFGIGGLLERHQIIGSIASLTWFYGGGGYVGFSNGSTYLGPTGVESI